MNEEPIKGMRAYEELADISIPKEQEEMMNIICDAWEKCLQSDCKQCPDRPKSNMRIMACAALKYTRLLLEAGYHRQSEWIPVSNPPKEDVRVNVWLGNNKFNDLQIDTDRMHNGEWVRWRDCVTHWMPLNVQEPQKGGE